MPALDELLDQPDRARMLSPAILHALLVRCAAVQTLLAARLARVDTELRMLPQAGSEQPIASAVDTTLDREYLSIRDLAGRIPYAERTIRNLMGQGRFRLGEHYIKPNGRVMFRWSAVLAWLDEGSERRR
jgi:hypothetical protein